MLEGIENKSGMKWASASCVCEDEFCGKKRVLGEAKSEDSRMGLLGEFERCVNC